MYALAVKNIDSVIRGTTKTTTELKCRILNDEQTADSVKQRLLVSAVKTLPQAEVTRCLDAAKKHEFTKIFTPRAKPRIENTAQSKELLDLFKSKGWIVSYSINEDNSGYEIQRPAPPKKRTLTHV